MKNYILLLSILILGLFNQSSFSQDLNMLKNAPFVFKGRELEKIPFKNENGIWMFAYAIEINSIYKGNGLKLDTIILIAESPKQFVFTECENCVLDVDATLSPEEEKKFRLGNGVTYLFFCNPYKGSLKNLPSWNRIIQTKNSIILEPICNTIECVFVYYEIFKDVNNIFLIKECIEGFGKKFMRSGKFFNNTYVWDEETSVWEKLDNYLKEIGLTFEKDTIKKKDVNYLDKKKENELLYAKRIKNYERLLKEYQLIQQQNLKGKKKDTNKDVEDITFSFENPIVTGTNPKFFEFDIMASGSTNNTYLDMAMFHLKYNAQVFGTHAVLNNRVHITRGPNFNNINYTDPDTIMADKTDTFSVMISRNGDYSPLNRTQITISPQTLLHVKMEIVNCTSTTDIECVDLFFTGMMTTYTLTPDEPATSGGTQYDNVNYPTILAYTLCPPPVITNIFPNPITSGTNSVLTIQGYNFGNTRGTSQLWMCNDENCSFTIMHFDFIDYISWSDTEIKFRVPSRVDTLQFFSPYKIKGVGSGNVYVCRNYGDTCKLSNSLPLEVSYANLNRSIRYNSPYSYYKKVPIRVVPDYGDTAKYFYLDTSITNKPERVSAIKTALLYWSCNTFINWAIKDTIEAQHFEDNISVIYMDDNYHGNPLGRTYFPSSLYLCRDDNGDTIGYYRDIDIGFSRDFSNINATTWFYDTSYTQNLPSHQQDFFAVAQHELGHAHGLDHVNDTTDIMYYTSKPGEVVYFYRLNLYSSPDAVNGGNYVFQKSQQIHSCGLITQMVPALSSNCISHVNNILNDDVYLYAYPNPMDDILTIFYNLKRAAIINITMYDYTGKKIKEINLGNQNMGLHNMNINVSNISSGLYFLSVKINNSVKTIKLMKQ